jgi:hypothetical protein
VNRISPSPYCAVLIEVFVLNLSPFSPITVEVEAVHTLKPDTKSSNAPSPSSAFFPNNSVLNINFCSFRIDFVWSGVTKRAEHTIAPKSMHRFAFTATFSHVGLYNVGEEKTWKVIVHKTRHSGQMASNVDILYPTLTHYVEINSPRV